jgi:hypothetical protein
MPLLLRVGPIAIGAVLFAAAAAACSDGGETTFAKQANAICREARKMKIPDRASARNKAGVARIDARIKRRGRALVNALAALDPPRGKEETVWEWLRHLRRANDAMSDILDASREGFATDAGGRLEAEYAPTTRLARKLGATDCTSARSYTSYAGS